MPFALGAGPIHTHGDVCSFGSSSGADPILRRLTNSKLLILRQRSNYPSFGHNLTQTIVADVTASGLTLGETHDTADIGGLVGFATLSDGRFVVLAASNVDGVRGISLHLFGADGASSTSFELVHDYDEVTLDGEPCFLFVGDYFNIIESAAGTLLVTLSAQNTDTTEVMLYAYQVSLSGSTMTSVGSPTKLMGYLYDDLGDGGLDPPINPIGAIALGGGLVVMATWGNKNGRTWMVAARSDTGGPEVVATRSLDTNIRLLEPILRRTTSGFALYEANDVWGSGHPTSDPGLLEGGDAVIAVPWDGTAFGTPVRTQVNNDSWRFWIEDADLYQAETWPLYQQEINYYTTAFIVTPGSAAWLQAMDFNLTAPSWALIPEMTDNPDWPTILLTPQDKLVLPNVESPLLMNYLNTIAYEGLTKSLGVVGVWGNSPLSTSTYHAAFYVVTRGTKLGAHVEGTRVRWS